MMKKQSQIILKEKELNKRVEEYENKLEEITGMSKQDAVTILFEQMQKKVEKEFLEKGKLRSWDDLL